MNYGLIGEHLSHSFSKPIHESFGQYTYELHEVARDHIDAFFQNKDFKAINVTIPYKQTAYTYCDVLDKQARSVGTSNCVVNKNGTLYGYNTDYDGIVYTLKKHHVDVHQKTVLILGKGGVAHAFYAVMKDLGAAEIQTVYYKPAEGTITYEEAYERYADADILINATPVGMAGRKNVSPIDLSKLTNLSFVFDAIYNPLQTVLIQQAKAAGIPAANGLTMLVVQAVKAAEHFLDRPVECDVQKIVDSLTQQACNIVLIGMPSCGKSHIGHEVAKRLHRPWIDLDEKIEKETGRRIAEIFSQDGETAFRDEETKAACRAGLKTGQVISCGGGIIKRKENMDVLAQNGIILYIDRPLENLVRKDPRRPLLQNNSIEKLYYERKDLYEKYSDETIHTHNQIQLGIQGCLDAYADPNVWARLR